MQSVAEYVDSLVCSACGAAFAPAQRHTTCSHCGKPLLVRYRIEALRGRFRPEVLPGRARSLWRYAEVLPVPPDPRWSLGEGWTPLLPQPRLGRALGLPKLYVKDESLNPGGSFKARGLAVAVAAAAARGVQQVGVASAGNAAGALALYAARLGLRAVLFLPEETPEPAVWECQIAGAEVHRVPGTIAEAGAAFEAYRQEHPDIFSVATLREPYRVEGKKTMGYELFEQLGGRLPDVILYPTGGGTGLIGMWKAFEEMEALGWIGPERPRMVAVQAAGCAPIVRAFQEGRETAAYWEDAQTIAAGLRVPKALGDFLILRVLRESQGTAVAVSDADIQAAMRRWAQTEGLLAAPEGAATLAALIQLQEAGWVHAEETVVLFNTATAHKYPAVVRQVLRQAGGPV
ncbi:threonine synthase [Rhodothermus profundi]|uniref:Threonine synthase n=1 Tax=Rhodothermus profundi TaxID=633813 RepID=A0A1M6XR55_9BACT|nr:threonine synthase [Rhodothermus profundi]SHL08434.1 threonine synthase [Rhodothermus profundi]